MIETALEAALRKAGAPVDESRLFTVAIAIVRQYGTTQFAVRKMCDELEKDQGLYQAIVAIFLRDRVADLAFSPHGEAASDHGKSDDQRAAVGRGKVEGEDGRETLDDQSPSAASPSRGTGRVRFENPHVDARPAPYIPKPPTEGQRLAAMRSRSETVVTILDTYKLATGEILGDLSFDQLANRQGKSFRDAFLIKQIRQHIQASGETRVRDAVKVDQIKIWLQQSAELADEHAI